MSDAEVVYSCDICRKVVASKAFLKLHYKRVHKFGNAQLKKTTFSSLPDKKDSSAGKASPVSTQTISKRPDNQPKTSKSKPAASAEVPRAPKLSRSERHQEVVPPSPTKQGSLSFRKDLREELASWLASTDTFHSRPVIQRHTNLLQKLVSSFVYSSASTSKIICNEANVRKTFTLLSNHIFATRNDTSKRLDFLQSTEQLYRAHLFNQKVFEFMKAKFGIEIVVFEVPEPDDTFDLNLSDSEPGMEVDVEPVLEPAAVQPQLTPVPSLPVEVVAPAASTSSGAANKPKEVQFNEDESRIINLAFEDDIIRTLRIEDVLVRCQITGEQEFLSFCKEKLSETRVSIDELSRAILKLLQMQKKRTPGESLDAIYIKKIREHQDSDEGLPVKSMNIRGKGKGVISTRFIKRGEFICEYVGELLTHEQAMEREDVYNKRGLKVGYMFYFQSKGKRCCIDATQDNGRMGRLINHSRLDANLKPRLIVVDDVPRLFFTATRDITANTELQYPYGENRAEILKENEWLKK